MTARARAWHHAAMVCRAVLLVVLFLVAGAAPGVAAAQDAADRPGQVEFQVGVTYYDAGRFLEAARAFEQSYEASRAPEILYNVYVAYRDAGRIDEAASALRRYLADAPQIRERAVLQGRLRSLDQQIAERDAARRPEPNHEPDVVRQPDPRHDPDPDADPEATPDDRGSAPVLPWILTGAGTVALIASGVLGLTVMSTYDELDSMCVDGTCPAELEDDRDRAETRAVLADVLLGAGIISAGIGIVLLVTGAGADADEGDEGDAGVACGPAGCAAAWRF